MKFEKVLVECPQCGHTQQEPPSAYSTNCRKCRHYIRLDEGHKGGPTAPDRAIAAPEPIRDLRQVTCFQCGTVLDVPPSAQSTMCKRCSSHLDLRDYTINSAVSKNFRTRGRFVVEESGYVFNTETVVADAVIKGRFLGKITADRSLEIHRTAEIKGTFKTGLLIIPASGLFRWPEPITPGNADLAGEVIASIRSPGRVLLRATARVFGNIEAAHLQVESGAILVGSMKIGPPE